MKIIIYTLSIIILFNSSYLYSEEKNEYRISITNNLNLREEPSIDSKIVMVNRSRGKEKKQLFITNSVKILKIENNEVIVNGNKGRWVFIDTGTYDSLTRELIKGWVFDYYLAKKEDFRRLEELPNNLDLKDEDSMFHYRFYKNGTAQFITKEKVMSGKLYIDNKNRVVIVQYDEQKEFFVSYDSFIYNAGKICMLGGGKADPIKQTVENACAKIVK